MVGNVRRRLSSLRVTAHDAISQHRFDGNRRRGRWCFLRSHFAKTRRKIRLTMTQLRTLRRERKRKRFWNMGTKTHLAQSALSNEPACPNKEKS